VLVKFKNQAKPLVRDSYRVIDQREGFERYMENYEDYDDEVEPDELLQPIDTATLMNVLANHGGIGEKVEEILAELAGGENNTQAQDITELGEGDMEKNSTNAPIVTELDGPNLRRSTRQAKPNQKVEFIYATKEQDETTKFMNLLLNDLDYICGLVEEAAIQGEQGKRAAAKIELERVWKKYGAIMPVKLDRDRAIEVINSKLFNTEKKDVSHNFTNNRARIVARGDQRKK